MNNQAFIIQLEKFPSLNTMQVMPSIRNFMELGHLSAFLKLKQKKLKENVEQYWCWY